MNCAYCHEDSTISGKHGDILNPKFIDTLRPYTEIAIGGGNPLSHPVLIEFINILKSRNIIANITVNQVHFEKNIQISY
jgi:organic radical activating enzyme